MTAEFLRAERHEDDCSQSLLVFKLIVCLIPYAILPVARQKSQNISLLLQPRLGASAAISLHREAGMESADTSGASGGSRSIAGSNMDSARRGHGSTAEQRAGRQIARLGEKPFADMVCRDRTCDPRDVCC